MPDLSGQADVYASIQRNESASSSPEAGPHTVSVVSDASSNALARIFSLLATLDVVPVSTRSSSSGHGAIDLRLEFEGIGENRIDRLCRKLIQLTDTISVDATIP